MSRDLLARMTTDAEGGAEVAIKALEDIADHFVTVNGERKTYAGAAKACASIDKRAHRALRELGLRD